MTTCAAMLARLALGGAAALAASSAASTQVPPRVEDMRGPIDATPLDWKWKKLSERSTFWDYVRSEGGPLVVSLPAAPGEESNGIGAHMARLFYEEGYSIGVLRWRDGRARRQSVSESVAAVVSQFGQVRADPERFGGFDPDRIIVFGVGDDAFPAALMAFNSGSLQSPDGTAGSPVCGAIFINGMNFDASSPDTLIAKKKFAEDPGTSQFSAIRYAAKAPPTLLMTRVLDSAGAKRSDELAAAIRAGGGIAVRATYARYEESDPTTILGYSENPSTDVIAQFLRTHCPAKAAAKGSGAQRGR